MKRKLTMLVAVAALALTTGSVGAVTISDYPAGTAANGIGGSRHNMGGLGWVIRASETTEICVFCHTPHHTNTANNLKPLWNRGGQAPTAFTAYGTTLGGTTVANTDIGSTTLACLSCHDGVTTFDNLVNAPGKSGVTAGGADRGWAFAMPVANEFIPPNTAYHKFNTAPFTCNLCHVNEQITRLTIGTDLSNDHPVSISYISGKAGLRTTDTVIGSIDLTSDLAASAATAFNSNLAQNRWAVKGFISDTATIADILRDGKVECSSCHDPHFRNQSWDEVEWTWTQNGMTGTGDGTTWCGNVGEACSDGQFLRRVGGNTGSGVCRTCHNK
ncbi:MAG: hypothetical protein IT362_06250 [Deltaproteobacteria bacterium]|nr:hypothetical protein [Deltaproteobacteria bacterium]